MQSLPVKRIAEPQQHLWSGQMLEIKKIQGPVLLGVCRIAVKLHLNSLNILYTAQKMQEAHKYLRLPPCHQFIHAAHSDTPTLPML